MLDQLLFTAKSAIALVGPFFSLPIVVIFIVLLIALVRQVFQRARWTLAGKVVPTTDIPAHARLLIWLPVALQLLAFNLVGMTVYFTAPTDLWLALGAGHSKAAWMIYSAAPAGMTYNAIVYALAAYLACKLPAVMKAPSLPGRDGGLAERDRAHNGPLWGETFCWRKRLLRRLSVAREHTGTLGDTRLAARPIRNGTSGAKAPHRKDSR